MSFVVTSVVLGAAVANTGTVTVPYPAGTNQAFFTGVNAAAEDGSGAAASATAASASVACRGGKSALSVACLAGRGTGTR